MTSEETENLWKEVVALREELQKERERSRNLEQQIENLKDSIQPNETATSERSAEKPN